MQAALKELFLFIVLSMQPAPKKGNHFHLAGSVVYRLSILLLCNKLHSELYK